MKIALTIDVESDIPHLLDTYFGLELGIKKILNLFHRFDIKGTFFCTGDVAINKPDLIQLIFEKGHEIGCHGFNHDRLNFFNFKECLASIKQNKLLIEKIYTNSNVIGFRAPYLKPPKYIFDILNELAFQYDSSFKSQKVLKKIAVNRYKIQEFHPLNASYFFRLPFGYSRLCKMTFNREVSVLFFHPWEAINIRDLMKNFLSKYKFYQNYLFRPDRWYNTGEKFMNLIEKFIRRSISNNVRFVRLKDLIR